MAIIKISAPSSLPLSTADYQAQNNQLIELIRNIGQAIQVNGSNVIKGAVFNVGGIIYIADNDTAISGTPSDYVKITPSGDTLTCTASFAANLTGVSWNKSYNGYYDGGGNLYIFDEIIAINYGVLSVPYTKYGTLISALDTFGINTRKGIVKLSGSGNFTVPLGVYNLRLILSGPGGGGGSSATGSSPGNDGTDGTDTTFGSLVAGGGKKGKGVTLSSPYNGAPGAGGIPTPGGYGESGASGSGGNGGIGPGGYFGASPASPGGYPSGYVASVPGTAGKFNPGGGGGGGLNGLGYYGGGGGGGALYIGDMKVTPGQIIAYSIGTPGSGGAAVGSGGAGGAGGAAGQIVVEY